MRVTLLSATGALVLAVTGPAAAQAAQGAAAAGAVGATAKSGSTASTGTSSAAPAGRAGGAGASPATTPTTTYVPSGGTPPAAATPRGVPGSTPTATAPTATAPATTSSQALFNKRFGQASKATAHKKRQVGTPAIVIAALAALVALACAAWALARHRAYEPHWWLSLRHAMAEAGFRASATWAEVTDWARLGR